MTEPELKIKKKPPAFTVFPTSYQVLIKLYIQLSHTKRYSSSVASHPTLKIFKPSSSPSHPPSLFILYLFFIQTIRKISKEIWFEQNFILTTQIDAVLSADVVFQDLIFFFENISFCIDKSGWTKEMQKQTKKGFFLFLRKTHQLKKIVSQQDSLREFIFFLDAIQSDAFVREIYLFFILRW